MSLSQHDVIQRENENPPLFTGLIEHLRQVDPMSWDTIMNTRGTPVKYYVGEDVVSQWNALKQENDDRLAIADIEPGYVVAEVASWLKQAHMVQTGGKIAKASNQEKRAALAIMHEDEAYFPPGHVYGHCWTLAQSSRMQFMRRTSVTEHTRTVPLNFAMPNSGGVNSKANKAYAYHIMAFGTAYIGLSNDLLVEPYDIPSLHDLMTIPRHKTADSPTLCHDCGNAYCLHPAHFYIASKTANDRQEKCHHFLHLMEHEQQLSAFQSSVCALFHKKPDGYVGHQGCCWTNNYRYSELDARRVTFSELTAEEASEGPLPY